MTYSSPGQLRAATRFAPWGVCLAAFWPGLIQNFQQGESWILKWAGSPTPTITKVANAA
jgi:hypothetical protein